MLDVFNSLRKRKQQNFKNYRTYRKRGNKQDEINFSKDQSTSSKLIQRARNFIKVENRFYCLK